MKRPIKFRGRRFDAPLVYGDLLHRGKNTYIQIPEGGNYKVHPESVAQLVGYDANGREVYEDDMLVDKEGNKFTARLVCRVLDDEGFLLDIPLEQLKLTEA